MTLRIQNQLNQGGRKVLSQAYLEANGLLPQQTEWRSDGRPIYDRLPAVGESYKRYFFGDDQEGYVFIGPQTGSNGPGSLEVVSSVDNQKILVHGGLSVWKYGTVEHPPVFIDLKSMDMRSTKYLIAYQMSYDESPRQVFEAVENYPILGVDLEVNSSTNGVIGWRNPPHNAFSASGVWKNQDDYFPIQPVNCFLEWSNEQTFAIKELKLKTPITFTPASDNSAHLFVDGSFVATALPSSEGYEFWLDNTITGEVWRVEWEHPEMEIENVLMTGSFPTWYRPTTTFMSVNLVAYPAYEFPEDGFAYCKLAYVDVDEDYRVTGDIDDIRYTINRDFQPIAEWITRPWDDLLIKYYEEHKNYVPRRMDPSTALVHTYSDLRGVGVELTDL